MGSSASKEITIAQSQVKSLTVELQKAQAILAQQKSKAEKADEYERQVAELSGKLSLEKANLELMTAELRREQQKLSQKQSFLQQLKQEKDDVDLLLQSSMMHSRRSNSVTRGLAPSPRSQTQK